MIKIDYRDARPIYEQVVDGIEGLALRGALPGGHPAAQCTAACDGTVDQPEHNTARLRRAGTPRCDLRRKRTGKFYIGQGAALRTQRLNELGEQITALAGQARSLGATEEQLRGWVERKGESRT